MRPLCALRNLVRLGCSIFFYPNKTLAAVVASRTDAGGLGLHHQPLLRHRVVTEDLALEDPHLDAAGPVGGLGGRLGIIDMGAKRVQRHPALAIAFGTRNLGTAETAAADDADALGAEAHRRLHRALHRTAERDPALQLVG